MCLSVSDAQMPRSVFPRLPEDGHKDLLLRYHNPASLRAWQPSIYPEALMAADTLSFYSHGAKEETQVQRGEATCPIVS